MLTPRPRNRARALSHAFLLVAAAFACLFLGRGRGGIDAQPQLLRVRELVPHEVEAGDRIAILGAGFPPGKLARVTFRGTLLRPGEYPQRGEEIVTYARIASPDRLELAFDEGTQSLFAGAGDQAIHTTFEGDVEVAFPAATPGAAPAFGVLDHAIVDVRPSEGNAIRDREEEGLRVLAWIGIKAVARGQGFVVEAVKPGSRAQAAGIAEGALFTRFNGVRVASAADVVSPPGARAATIEARAEPSGIETSHVVALDGLRRSPPAERIAAALIGLIALGIVLLFAAPTGATLAAAMQRVVARVRERAGTTRGARAAPAAGLEGGAPGSERTLLRTLAAAGRAALPPPGLRATGELAACALFGALPFGQCSAGARIDVGVIFVAAATSLAVAAFVANGSWRGARAAMHVALQHVPGAMAVASVVLTTGSLRAQEIERAQGGWPWDWLAFRSPGTLVALGVLLSCTRIEPGGAPPSRERGLSRLLEEGRAPPAPLGPWIRAACRTHHFVIAGLASTLFLGGWHLPGPAAQRDAGPVVELAEAGWLLVKTSSVVVIMAWVWGALLRCDASRTRSTWLRLGLIAAGALASTAAWTWWSPSPSSQLLASISLVATVALAAIALAQRLRHGLTSAAAEGRMSGFI